MPPLPDDKSEPTAMPDDLSSQNNLLNSPPAIKKAIDDINKFIAADVTSSASGSNVHLNHSTSTIQPLEQSSSVSEEPIGKPDEPSVSNTFELAPAIVTFSPETKDSELNKTANLNSDPVAIDKPSTTITPSSSLDSAAPAVIAPSVSVSPPSPTNLSSEEPSHASVIPQQTSAPVIDGKPTVSAVSFSPFSPKKAHSKGLKFGLIGLIAVIILGGGAAAAYFGYYMNPSVIWSQSMSNMNTGYNKLTSYLNEGPATHYKGVDESGSFQLITSGSNYSGSLDVQSDGSNATVSIKADLGIANLDLEGREITAPGNSTPDIYVQLNGIKSLGSYLGSELGPKVDSLDGQWIEIDHNLLADIENAYIKQENSQATKPQLTWSDVNSFLQAASAVDKQYLFTTNSQTSVTKVIKDLGMATVNGHSTYHYEVGFVPAHVKAYISAMCNALQQSAVGTYIKQETGDTVGSSSTCTNLENSAAKINSSDTIGVWVDTGTRLIYQVQVAKNSNPAEGYTDIGLNYKGGDIYPFFVDGSYKASSGSENYSVTASLNKNTSVVDLVIDFSTTGSDQIKFASSFNLTPSNSSLKLSAPSGAVPITTVLNNFGLGGYVSELQGLSGASLTNSAGLEPDLSRPNALLLSELVNVNSSLNLNGPTVKD